MYLLLLSKLDDNHDTLVILEGLLGLVIAIISRVGSKYTFWDQIQIQLGQAKYIAFLDFNTNKNFQYKYTAILLFKYESNTLPSQKFDSNTV